MRFHRRVVLVALILAVLVLSPLAVAADGGSRLITGDAPAVEAPREVVDEKEEPWTARFLAPTVLLIGIVALGGSIFYYGSRVRGKYRVTS